MKKNQSQLAKSVKVALVHDYLLDYGGAERVLEELHQIFPEAPVYVAFKDEQALGIHWQRFASWQIRETWIASIPFHRQLFSPLRVFAPFAFRDLDLSGFDVVISSSNAYFAKAIKVKKPAIHICYCHTPARSLYGYTTMTDWQKNPITHFVGTIINHFCRVIDVRVAQEVDFFLANSAEVKRRIAKFYRRDATVIYPPVNISEKLDIKNKRDEYYLYVGRLAKSKHVDLAIAVCSELNLPLKIAGTGKGFEYLKSIAGSSVEFLGAVSDQELTGLYGGAKAVFFPAEDEDFGIVPVEAMGHGVPVIAHYSGGPKETIIDGVTGVFFRELSQASVKDAVLKFQSLKFDAKKIHHHALQFSQQKFAEKVSNFVAEKSNT